MKITWEEKDFGQLGCIVLVVSSKELFITSWVGQTVGLVSLNDGMFLKVGDSHGELADYLNKYAYVPLMRQTRAVDLIDFK